MKVLLFANIGTAPNKFYHAGDEAMFLETYNWYKKHHPNTIITILTSQPNHSNLDLIEIINPLDFQFINLKTLILIIIKSLFYKHLKFNLLSPNEFKLFSILKEQNRVHLCGGGNLTSLFRGWFYYSLVIIAISQIQKKEIILTSQTIGPFNLIDKIIVFFLLNHVKLIAVRGKERKLTNYWIYYPKIINMLDSAYNLPTKTDKPIPAKKAFRIGLSLNDWKMNNQFFHSLIQSLNTISSQKKIEVLLIPHVIVDDKDQWDMGFMIKQLSLENCQFTIIKPSIDSILSAKPEPSYYLKKLTSSVDLLISTRYHGIIFALSENIPVITFATDEYYIDKNINALKIYYPKIYKRYIISSNKPNHCQLLNQLIFDIIKNHMAEKTHLEKINSKLLKNYDLFLNNLNNKILD